MNQNQLAVFCETRKNPIGIDNPAPRFSWHPDTTAVCREQESYRITVEKGGACVWDSGEVHSRTATMVPYAGTAPESFTVYRFTVRIRLTDGSVWQGSGTFETGILRREEWQGDFLCYPAYEKRMSPVFLYRFSVKREVVSCRAYFCGLGYGELYLNGKKADRSVLDPGWTDYNIRMLYRTFDMTDAVRIGRNQARILLADGWMAHNHRYFRPKPPLPWYHEPCFLLNIRVTYADGQTETFYPDETSCRANTGEILSQNLFDGEEYSAPRAAELERQAEGELTEADGWIAPAKTKMTGTLSAQTMPPIVETEVVEPVRVASISASTYVLDMGVNFSGYARITVSGEAGSTVRMRYSELANPDDSINQVNLRYAACCDTYHLSGNGTEVWSPRFTYRGYRFLELELQGMVRVLKTEGIRVNSAAERIGSFSCDHALINRIWRMLINTEQNNMHSVPTDCPQRDERLGWMNDNTMRLEQNFMNFDSQLFYEKWFRDILDQQEALGTGAVPDTCPYYYGMRPARWNASVFVMLPYEMYRYFGDRQTMERHWRSILWYMEYQKTKLTSAGLVDGYFVGEWCPPMKDSILEDHQSAFPREISNQLMTSCFYYMDCMLCVSMAELLGDAGAAREFRDRMRQMREAINRTFFDAEAGCYLPRCQGNQILPLAFGIVPDGERTRVGAALTDCIIRKDYYHISTGSHATRFLFRVLGELGAEDLAIRMLSETGYPSFGYMLENGATALWERWEKNLGFMTSHDHPMTGGFGVWFFTALGGIQPGADHLRIAPTVPRSLKEVHCKRQFRTGTVMSSWHKVGQELHFEFRIPWNLPTEILLPRLGCDIGELTVNGEPAAQCGRVADTPEGFRMEVGMGYWHMVLRRMTGAEAF